MIQIYVGLHSGDLVQQVLGAQEQGIQIQQQNSIYLSDQPINIVVNIDKYINLVATGNKLLLVNINKQKVLKSIEFPGTIQQMLYQSGYIVVCCGERIYIVGLQSFRQVSDFQIDDNVKFILDYNSFNAYLIITSDKLIAQGLSKKDKIAEIDFRKTLIIRQVQLYKTFFYILTEENKIVYLDLMEIVPLLKTAIDIQKEVYQKDDQQILRLTRSFYVIDRNTMLLGNQHGELYFVNKHLTKKYKLGDSHITDIKQINQFYYAAIHGQNITIFALDINQGEIYIIFEQKYDSNIISSVVSEYNDNQIKDRYQLFEEEEEEYYEEE